MRSLKEIVEAEVEFFDKVWYERKCYLLHKIAEHGEPMPPEEIMDAMEKHMRRLEKRYPELLEESEDPFDTGMNSGKLSALRWVLGDEWDMLDT